MATAAEVMKSYIHSCDLEEIASRAWPNRHLREEREILETPEGKLAKLAEKREEELKRNLVDFPKPLFKEV